MEVISLWVKSEDLKSFLSLLRGVEKHWVWAGPCRPGVLRQGSLAWDAWVRAVSVSSEWVPKTVGMRAHTGVLMSLVLWGAGV